jgi:hypothetical protein
MFKDESKESNKFIYIILGVFILVILIGGGIIYKITSSNKVPNTTPNNDGNYKPPTIYNSPIIVRNNLSFNNTNNVTHITEYALLHNDKNITAVIRPQNKPVGHNCCYPKECQVLYNNTPNCDSSCEYPIECFTLPPNMTIDQYLGINTKR